MRTTIPCLIHGVADPPTPLREVPMKQDRLWLVLPLAALIGCGDGALLTDTAGLDARAGFEPPPFADARGAVTERGIIDSPFPPDPNLPFVPVSAPCLGLGEPLQMSGTWSGWFTLTLVPAGRVRITEHIDYADVALRLGTLMWVAGPGASETIVQILPATIDDFGEAAYVVRHQFTARYLSQDGLSDLLVTHSLKAVLGPDLQFRHNEFVPFSAECIGNTA